MSLPHRFVGLNLGKGSVGYGGSKLSPYRLFVVDVDLQLPARTWTALKKHGEVFVPNSDGRLQYVYEFVLGRNATDRERILYNNTDSLDLRRANLSYVNIYDPTIPQAVFKNCPNFAVEHLEGYADELAESYVNFEAAKKQQRHQHAWAVAKAKGSLTQEQVLALLHFYSDLWTDEEINKRTDVRLGTDMDTCRSFIEEDLGAKAPSERHIRNILKGESLRLQGHDVLYAKVAKLLPTYKSLLVPLPKQPTFKPFAK